MVMDEEDAGPPIQLPPRPSSGGGTHYLAKCVLKGSAVLHAVHGHFRSPSSFDVVFGKETSLELVLIGEDGVVQSICEQTLFGIIKDLAVLRWSDRFHESMLQAQGKDILVVLSDSGKLSFLAFCSEMHRFFAVTHVELSKPGNYRHLLGRMLAVDPEGCYIAVSAQEDRFAIFSVALTSSSNIIDEKICYPPENEEDNLRDTSKTIVRGTIWSMCFISCGINHFSREGYNPVLAVVMHRKGCIANDLLLFGCNPRTHAIQVISRYSESGPLALNISAVPHFSGFAFLFRLGDVLLMDLRDPEHICSIHRISLNSPSVVEERNSVEDPCRGSDVDDEGMFNVAACALLELRDSADEMVKDDDPMNIDSGDDKGLSSSRLVCSWNWEPAKSTSSKMIFCLNTGELFIMEINFDVEGIRVNLSECLYRGLPCRAVLWAKGGLIAGLVEMGDGMVLKLVHGKLVYKNSIQNIAPILDISIADYHDEKQDQIFACCGMSPEGSLRIIRSGISVEKLLRTASIYVGVAGIWTLRMKETDIHHSFLVLSFVEETRVLSVGLSFNDVSDAVGFQPDVCTLACGLMADGLLVQIHNRGVRLCLPTTFAHPDGAPFSVPICTSWCPDKVTIIVGAVGHELVIVATSSPCILYILGVRLLSAYHYELYEIRHMKLLDEVSCISIPREGVKLGPLASKLSANNDHRTSIPHKNKVGKIVVIGTHKPSVEILSLEHDEPYSVGVLAVGLISINNAFGCPISGCIPEDVRLVSIDRSYILSGLRNGMLLRFEWPALSAISQSEESMPVFLELIAVRRIGISPVVLVPLQDSPDADIIVLSDRPWLLHSARHSLAYSSISFQQATHVTPVSSVDCPMGILFVAENSLNLVEMVHNKRLNVQKFSIAGTPREVLYHSKSKTLLVRRTQQCGASISSDICRVDPLSGFVLSKFKCDPGESAKCMQIVRVGNEQVLIVGTSQSAGQIIMPSGEAEGSGKGRIIVLSLETAQISSESSSVYCSNLSSASQIGSPFREIVGYATEQLSNSSLCSSPDDIFCDRIQLEEMGAGHLRPLFQTTLSGAVVSVCPYLDRYILASAGNMLNVFGFVNENPHRLRKFAMTRTRFTITCLRTHFTRIAVGDCRDGILFYSYNEELRKLEQMYSDPARRLVADCALMDCQTAVVSDRFGIISVLSCPDNFEANESPEKNLKINCSFYMGEVAMSIQKASFSYKLPVDDLMNSCNGVERILDSAYNSVVASTLLGSVMILIPITSEEHQLLEAVQARLAIHPLTSPVLGNDHKEFRGRGVPARAGVPTILDGDMLVQFLELTSIQQEAVLALSGIPSNKIPALGVQHTPISVNHVVRVLERVHYALN
ncbi:uncharacterized protein [Typha angustifolia]|uniref:uncharacterized protein isoform X1 n=2 Tax=Typha angustifolia TaxID=59011 RepID=UPI003C2CD67A